MHVVWNGALDKQRQEEARRRVPPKQRCTMSLIGDTGHQGSAMDEMSRHIERQADLTPPDKPASQCRVFYVPAGVSLLYGREGKS